MNGLGGSDNLNGGTGNDTVDGGAGNDELHATGGGADVVDCGPGFDRVYKDRSDRAIRGLTVLATALAVAARSQRRGA